MIPAALLSSLHNVPGFDEGAFCQVHNEAAPPISLRMHPRKWEQAKNLPVTESKVAWSEFGFYLHKRPIFTLDPLLHAGAYYVQEASSMFVEQAMNYITAQHDKPFTALDLCAAPGGKSTHLLSLLPKDSVLVCNEVIHNRTTILLENIIKWGCANCIVTQNDPADFGKLEPMFDIILVDAPCSGSGLFRRDAEATSHWSEQAVENCRLRQQRILADALPCLLPGGYLIYATCSYSPAEDEAILDYLSSEFGMKGISLSWPDGQNGVVATQSPLHGIPCYRFYPDKVRGEGFFMALMQKSEEIFSDSAGIKMPKTSKSNIIPGEVMEWLHKGEGMQWYRHETACYLIPDAIFKLFNAFQKQLHIRKAGVRVAEEVHGRYQPAHDFALCDLIKVNKFPLIKLETKNALSYLRKENFDLPNGTPKGQLLVMYDNLPLGWLKNLGNRFNNYYPKEWRIKMKVNG